MRIRRWIVIWTLHRRRVGVPQNPRRGKEEDLRDQYRRTLPEYTMARMRLRADGKHGIEMIMFRGERKQQAARVLQPVGTCRQDESLHVAHPRTMERMASGPDKYEIQVPAPSRYAKVVGIYCFAIDGKQVLNHRVSCVKRSNSGGLDGYQRPEVLSHIRAIRRYLESPGSHAPECGSFAFDSLEFTLRRTVAGAGGLLDQGANWSSPSMIAA